MPPGHPAPSVSPRRRSHSFPWGADDPRAFGPYKAIRDLPESILRHPVAPESNRQEPFDREPAPLPFPARRIPPRTGSPTTRVTPRSARRSTTSHRAGASRMRSSTNGSAGPRSGCGTGSGWAGAIGVAVLSHNDSDVFEVQFACQRLGAIFLPINWRLATPEIEFICGDAEPRAFLYGVEFEAAAAQVARTCAVEHAAALANGGSSEYEAGIAGASGTLADPGNGLGDTLTIMYTSGTTGRPKGARNTYRMGLYNTLNSVVACDVGPRTRNLVFLPTFHTGGLNVYANPVFHTGGNQPRDADLRPGAFPAHPLGPRRRAHPRPRGAHELPHDRRGAGFRRCRSGSPGAPRGRRRAGPPRPPRAVRREGGPPAAALGNDGDRSARSRPRRGPGAREGRFVRPPGDVLGARDRRRQGTPPRPGGDRRADDPRTQRHPRLLEPPGGEPRGIHRGRMVPHRRRGPHRRGRLLLHRGPMEGHVHLGGRERVPGRGRERHLRARRGARERGGRGSRT